MPLLDAAQRVMVEHDESIQRILARALAGQTPTSPTELIRWLEATARDWNADPTPFEWLASAELVAS